MYSVLVYILVYERSELIKSDIDSVQGRWWRNDEITTDKIFNVIKNLKRKLRLTYRQSCTKLEYTQYVPEEAYVKYQSMVLQQVDGLREVPVQSQAEAHRSYSGTAEAITRREDRACQ